MKIISTLCVLTVLLLQSCNLPDDSFVDLNASVKHSSTQIVIKNNDAFQYQNLKIEINSKYEYKHSSLLPGETLNIGYLKFVDKNHNRFNPFSMQASKISVTCNIPNGRRGYLYGEMD